MTALLAMPSTGVSADAGLLDIDLTERPDTLTAQQHRAIVARVMCMYQAAKRDQPDVPDVYQSRGEWDSYLRERDEFHHGLLAGDVALAERKLRNFWRNELGAIVKEYARFEQLASEDEAAKRRFRTSVSRNYLIWQRLFGAPAAVLLAPAVGNPWGCLVEGELIAPKAVRFHALASQIGDLVASQERPLIVEIGGGYGGALHYVLRDVPSAVCVDFDLPETLVLAAYNLLCSFPERKFLLYGEEGCHDPRRWSEHAAVLLPNFELPRLADVSVDLFLNSFSLSEMPRETLTEYLGQMSRAGRRYFLHNNMDRRGVVNRGHERIPASDYPIDNTAWRRVYRRFDLFHGHEGDYREYLYVRSGT